MRASAGLVAAAATLLATSARPIAAPIAHPGAPAAGLLTAHSSPSAFANSTPIAHPTTPAEGLLAAQTSSPPRANSTPIAHPTTPADGLLTAQSEPTRANSAPMATGTARFTARPPIAAVPAQIARSATPPRDASGLHLVPADVAAVLRVDPAEIERVAELVRGLGGEIGLAATLAAMAAATSIGFDPLARTGWQTIGVDAAQPIVVALDAVDPTEPRTVWHVRLVARVAQPERFADWAGRIPGAGESWRPDRPARGVLARILGLESASGRVEMTAARALVAAGTLAAAAVPALDALLFVRRSGGFAVLDLFSARDAATPRWTLDGERILAQLALPAAGAAISDHKSAAVRALAGPGLVFWTRAGRVFDAILAWNRPPATCLAFRDFAPLTVLEEGALALQVHPDRIALDLLWAAAARAPLTHTWILADDGLVGPPLVGEAIVAASLYLGGTARLRALPRPSLIESGWVPFWRRLRTCGRGARTAVVLFAWPEIVGQWLADVAAVAPQAGRLVGAIRNLGFAARRVAADGRHDWEAVLEGSLTPDGQAPARAVLDAIFGRPDALRAPRPHTSWTGNFLHPYMLPRRHGAILGVALGRDSRAWRIAQPVARARRGDAGGILARGAGDAAALLRQLAPDLSPRLRALATSAASRIGSFEISIAVAPDALRAALMLRRP